MAMNPQPSPPPAKTASWQRSLVLWGASLALILPATIPYLDHYLLIPKPDLLPTGYLVHDMVYYMANAKKHFDDGEFHLSYGLAFSHKADTPRVYFQPQTLLFAVLWKYTGWPPGVIFVGFGVLCGIVGMRLALGVFETLFGLRGPACWLAAIVWCWGGGVLVLAGLFQYLQSWEVSDLLYFDPFNGFWFLNLGRNFIFPTEAYYHAIFLGMVCCLLREYYRAAALLLVLLSVSHPFTGVESILIVLCWAMFERWWVGNQRLRALWVGALGVILTAHLGYYMVFLNLASPEHRILQKQWTLDWTIEIQHFGPAYFLVGALAYWSIRGPQQALVFFSDWRNRFLLIWFLVAFALANHEFAIKPAMQPLHFTRGYEWMPLFLMGAPVLIRILEYLLTRGTQGIAGIVLVMAIFLADNATFLGTFHAAWPDQVYFRGAHQELIDFLDHPANHGSLLLSPDEITNYYVTSNTPVRAWFSHEHNTPEWEDRKKEVLQFYLKGTMQPDWEKRTLFVLFDRSVPLLPWIAAHGGSEVYANREFKLYRIDPRPKTDSR